MYRIMLSTCIAILATAIVAGVAIGSSSTTNGLLVYEAHSGKHLQLFTVKPDGTGTRQVTHFTDSDAVWPEWSPDGKQIVFERDVFKSGQVVRAAISVINADGSGPRSLTPTGLNGRPSWSTDGRTIVFNTLVPGKQATVSVMSADGRHPRTVASVPLPAKGFAAFNSPRFSPDGKRIAFVWIKDSGTAIFTVGASGAGLKQLTPWKNQVADKIGWSPDGSRIAFSSPEFGGRPGVSANVYTVRPDGSGRVELTHDRGGEVNNGFDSWSPDGTKIAFASNRGGTYSIYAMNTDGTSVVQITKGTEAHHAAWGSHL